MGLFDFFSSNKKEQEPSLYTIERLVVDLSSLSFNKVKVGEYFHQSDYLYEALQAGALSQSRGVEVSIKDMVLESVFVTLADFEGQINYPGIELFLGQTVVEIINVFGEPYWLDKEDGETILFYEYNNGATEVQFEFDEGALSCLLIAKDGVLSTQYQREVYGVDKPWPPQ